MTAMGVPVVTEHFKRIFLQEVVCRELAELMRALVPMKDAQASFQILRLSAASHLSHLLRTVPPSITCQPAADWDILMEWVVASIIIAVDGAATAGLPTPKDVAPYPPVCPKKTLWDTRLYGRPTCPSKKVPLDLPEAVRSKAWSTSVTIPWSWDVSSLPPPRGTFHPF